MFDKSGSFREGMIFAMMFGSLPDTGTPSMSVCKKMGIYIHELFVFATSMTRITVRV